MFKPPLVHLQLEYANGTSWQGHYRLIPAIGHGGFIISPRVDTADHFVDLAIGNGVAFGPSRRPIAARVTVDKLGSWAYDKKLNVALRMIDMTELAHNQLRMLTQGEERCALTALYR